MIPYLVIRKGMVIPIAVFVIGILAVMASVYSLSSRQGKLMSRRIFWGEITYFLAESIIQEAFHEVDRNPDRYMNLLLKAAGRRVKLDYTPRSVDLMETGYGLGLGANDVLIEGKLIPLSKGGEELLTSGDLTGVLRITVTVKVTAQRMGSKALVRRISANRGIRYVNLGGGRSLTPYLLFLKERPLTPSQSSVSEVQLTLRRTSPKLDYGRIFLGGDLDTQNDVRPYRILPGSVEKDYLDRWGTPVDEEISIEDMDPFQGSFERDRNRVLMDVIWWDPRFKRITGKDSVDRSIGENRALGWLRSYFQAVPTPQILYRLQEDYTAHSDVWNLRVDSPVGVGLPLEGKAFQKYLLHTTATYPVGGVELDPETSTFLTTHSVPVAQLFQPDPLRRFAGWRLFQGIEPYEKTSEDSRKNYAPFREVQAYSEIYPEIGKIKPWSYFLMEHSIDFQSHSLLFLDGISGVMGDMVIDRPMRYRGQGVIVVMGKVLLTAPISRDPTDPNAFLMIVTRSKSGFSAPIQIDTSDWIEAYLQAHSFPSASSKKGTLKANSPFKIRGGLSLDYLDINSLPEGSILETDPDTYREIQVCTIQRGFQFYKVFNNERPESVIGE
ncbi:hypothetical protein HOF92_01645 [bacterium]|jgi:hypothetical protein|nr:hypothetical protein [bacterium]